jgi:hypothetical protein
VENGEIWKGEVVWKLLNGTRNEIYYWNGKYKSDGSPTDSLMVSSTNLRAYSPQMDENLIVFREFHRSNYEICIWKKGNISTGKPDEPKCTEDTGFFSAYNPQISEGEVVWQRFDGQDIEIYYWDGKYKFDGTLTEPIKITNNTFDDQSPVISHNRVVWEGSYEDKKAIYYWDGTYNSIGAPSEPILISNISFDNYAPRIDMKGYNIVWEGLNNGHKGIYYWDHTFKTKKGILISNKTTNSYFPQIDNDKVIWVGKNNGNSTIYYLDLKSIIQKQ